jgi:glutamate formiminotransferase/formiminotetrahydrofolate cyclodeaminase
VPGGGSVVAYTGTLAAALTEMVAGLTIGRKKYAAVDAEMKELAARASDVGKRLAALVTEDADSYALVSAAYKMPKDTPGDAKVRDAAIQSALVKAAEVPLETARACVAAAKLAAVCAQKGNTNAVSDAAVAALLAEASCKGAAYNVRINVSAMADPGAGKKLADEAAALAHECASAAIDAISAVERAIGG